MKQQSAIFAAATMCLSASICPALPGDMTNDGRLNAGDWTQIAVCLTGPATALSPACSQADTDQDGDVDLVDLHHVLTNWNSIDCDHIVATASSVENGDTSLAPQSAVDGLPTTRWSSEFHDNEWIEVDYGLARQISGVRIVWETAHASAYTVSLALGGEPFTPVYGTTSGDGGLDELAFAPRQARYLRIDCQARATEWGNSIFEIELISADTCYRPVVAPEDRIESLLEQMTLQEKSAFVHGQTSFDLRPVPRLGIPSLTFGDGPVGLRGPAATAFPAGIAMASTWNTDLIYQAGVAMGREFRNHGKHVWLGPCINIIRVPHGGRDFETYGEDPYLTSRLAVSIIEGAQSQDVIACAKHYIANNQEFERTTIDVQVDERSLREIYMPGFKAAVQEAGVKSVMASYNRINGPYATAHHYLLNDVLKNEWGFEGFVVSDWGAVHETVATANAGLDLEMDGASPVGAYWGNGQLLGAIQSGQVAEATLDDKVRRILRTMESSGILDEAWPAPGVELIEHRALMRQLAREGIVLLKNDTNLLPLSQLSGQTLALIGPNAATARVGGGGSSAVNPPYTVSPLQGIENAVGNDVDIVYALGAPLGANLPAIDPAFLSHGPNDTPGLMAEYFDNQNLGGIPAVTRVDESIDFDWGEGSPASGIPADGFSVRWTGRLRVPTSGSRQLAITIDDGARVYFNNQLIIDAWTDQAATTYTYTLPLQADQAYDLRIEYYENGGSASAQLSMFDQTGLEGEAVAAAASADAALVFVGLSKSQESEGYDRASMDLPADQVSLIQAVAGANPHTAVVIVAGSQVGMDAWIDAVPTVLQAWYGGQEQGNAIADILFGDHAPSGKLPMTFVRRWKDHPAYNNYPGNVYTEGLYVGYRYFDTFGVEPLFPFGHGLSYTQFAYSNASTSANPATGEVELQVTVTNTGAMAGAEVVQVYVRDVAASVDRPAKELKAFRKVFLDPGEQQQITFTLKDKDFCFYDTSAASWVREPGAFELLIGSSSRDIRLTETINLP